MLIVAVNACFAGLLTPVLRSRWPTVSCAGVIAACGAALVYGEWRLSQPFATGESVKVAVIQGALGRQERRNPGHSEARLQHYLALTKEAAETHPDLIFWPEYAIDFPLQHAPERRAVLDVTRDIGADLILGGPHYGYSFTAVHYYNSVFLIRKGKIAGRYDKLFLLPFAEEARLTWLFPPRKPEYTPGRDLRMLYTRAAPVGT